MTAHELALVLASALLHAWWSFAIKGSRVKALYDAVAGAPPATLDELVPPSSAGTTLIYEGRNSLALFTRVQKRFLRTKSGVIVGYTVQLRPDARPNEIRAWMGILVEGNQTREVIASLLGEPGVAELHDTNGRWDLLAELRATSMAELSQVLERIRLLKGIRGTETSIHLATYR